jgi:opacity protein-like surface antigen
MKKFGTAAFLVLLAASQAQAQALAEDRCPTLGTPGNKSYSPTFLQQLVDCCGTEEYGEGDGQDPHKTPPTQCTGKDTLSSDERIALYAYSRRCYDPMIMMLVGQTPMTPACAAVIDQIEAALAKFPSYSGSTVYRGQQASPPSPLETRQLLSTSASPAIALNFSGGSDYAGVILEIHTRPNGRGKHIVYYSANSNDEDEVLFPPHSKFKTCSTHIEGLKTNVQMAEVTDNVTDPCKP